MNKIIRQKHHSGVRLPGPNGGNAGYAEGFLMGQPLAGRELQRLLLVKRFDILPIEVFHHIEVCEDSSRLLKAAVSTLTLRSLDDFQL